MDEEDDSEMTVLSTHDGWQRVMMMGNLMLLMMEMMGNRDGGRGREMDGLLLSSVSALDLELFPFQYQPSLSITFVVLFITGKLCAAGFISTKEPKGRSQRLHNLWKLQVSQVHTSSRFERLQGSRVPEAECSGLLMLSLARKVASCRLA